MDSHIIFTKTPKAARAPLPWAGGLSAQSKRVLSHVDGHRTVEEILRVSEKMSSSELHRILLKLEEDGYIKRALNQQAEPDWLKDAGSYAMNNYSIAVEEIDASDLDFGSTRFGAETTAQTAENTQPGTESKTTPTVDIASETKSEEIMAAKARREEERKAQVEAAKKAKLEAAEQAKRIAEAGAKARQEVERIEREKAEAIAKAQAEERARIEAERKAQQEAAERARLEAERIAREEAERKAKAEAEERARIEAERKAQEEAAEQARLEAERIAREEAERKAKAEAEEKARIEAERIAREQAEAEERARIEAERKAQEEAAEQARLEAERIAREEAERKAKAEAEEKARIEAERIAREQAEAKEKARIEAERKAQEEAAERARLEAERIAREEAERKAKAEAEEIARIEAERIAQFEEAERKLREAERVAREAMKAQQEAEKKAQAEAEKAARAEAKRIAKEEKAEKARIKAEEKARAKAARGPLVSSELRNKLLKPLLIAIPLGLVLIVGLLHVINLSMLISPIEKLASESIGETVKVGQVHAALLPQPRLVLADVAVGSSGDIRIAQVKIASGISMFFNDTKDLESIEIRGVTLTPAEFARQSNWVNKVAKSGKLKVGQITLKQISFKASDLDLAAFDGKVALTSSGMLASVELENTDTDLKLQLTPHNGNCAVTLTASDWQLPMLAPLTLDEVTATGVVSDNQLSFSEIEAKAYGGIIKAQGELRWSGALSASGNFELVKMTLPRVLTAYGSGAAMEGMLNAKAMFSSNVAQASALANAAEVNASFELVNGKVNNIALSHAVMAGAVAKVPQESNFTRFDTVTGNLLFKDGNYRYQQLELKTDQFRARGNLDIAPDKKVSGKISAELASKTVRRQASFNVGGTPADIRLQ